MYQSEERSAEKTDQCGTKKDSILWYGRTTRLLFCRFKSIVSRVRYLVIPPLLHCNALIKMSKILGLI
jgi:hypothetical protein